MQEEDDLIRRMEAAQKVVDSGELDYMIVESNSGIRFAVFPKKRDGE